MKKSLNGKWLLDCQFGTNLKVNVPGSIYNDLYKYKFIEHPYYRNNEEKMLDVMNYDYTYHRSFKISDKDLKKNIDLVFLGLDTICEIYLNGQLLGKTYNMHRRYRFNANPYLKSENEIKIIVKSPLAFIQEEEQKCTHELMQMHYAVKGYNHIRKAHSMFGWDWGPQMPDGGIWRSVYLEIYEYGYIDNVWFNVLTIAPTADIKVKVRNNIIHNDHLKLELKLLYDNIVIYQEEKNCQNLVDYNFTINHPHLWYPFGYGEQPLYELVVNLKHQDKIIQGKKEFVGIRKCEIKRKPDEFGESFTVSINDCDIFLKGSDYIIEDNVFPWRSNQRTKYLLDSAILGNQNTLRVWGGGIYPDDYFYEECDRLGILVWQDLMFACTYYNMENTNFVREIKEEIIDNMERIRNHACIILICGNNENETAISWNVPNIEYTKKWYLYQYEDFIPKILETVTPHIFYWPSSPSSGGGFDNPNDDARGDMHYWGVWHNNEPIEYYRFYYPRIMSEFGMQSFPLLKTVKTFTNQTDRNIFSYVMERHQKNTSANQKIMNYIGSMFKFPKNFEMLLYISEIIQAEGVRYCVEHLRRNMGRCMGSIYWQLNDCWPVASWSSIDYYGRYKALQYYSKKFYAPILISIEENYDDVNSSAKIIITNEKNHNIEGIVTATLMDFSGNIIEEKKTNVNIAKFDKAEIMNLEFTIDKELRKQTVLKVVFPYGNIIYSNQVSFCKDKYLELIKPNIQFDLVKNEDGYDIIIESDTFAKYVFIDCLKGDFIYSDNFFNLFPKEKQIIHFKTSKDLKKKDFRIISLFDEFE